MIGQSFKYYVLKVPNSSIIHLFLAQSVNLNAGTKRAKHIEIAPKRNLLPCQVQNQRTKASIVITRTSTKGENDHPDQNRGVILSYLLKGEPPYVFHHDKLKEYQGKTLNSQRRMKTNLLSLGADYIVSRSKPFQERDYDVDIKSTPTMEHGDSTKVLTKTNKRHVRELYSFSYSRFYPNGFSERGFNEATPLMCMEGKVCSKSLIIRKPLRPQENQMTKILGKNQPGRTEDIGVLHGAYLPNQEEINSDSNCSRNYTHQGTSDKKNRLKSFPHEEDIKLSSWWISKEPEVDQRLLIEELRSNQDEPSCKPTCFGSSTHQRHVANWIHTKITYGLKVIQFLNQEITNLTYLEVFAIKIQQLFSLPLSHDLETLDTFQKVSRNHLYLPKLSRYKEIWPHHL